MTSLPGGKVGEMNRSGTVFATEHGNDIAFCARGEGLASPPIHVAFFRYELPERADRGESGRVLSWSV
jgi:hypothetical protein